MKRWVCGVDAGASKTACAVCTEDGLVLATVLSGPAAFRHSQASISAEAVLSAITAVCHSAGLDRKSASCLVVGWAGVDSRIGREEAAEAIRTKLEGVELLVYNDAAIALEAATSRRPAGILMAGTGSIAYGEGADGASHRLGGWGHIFGDEGGAYRIAVDALGELLRCLDRGSHASLLEQSALSHFQLTAPEQLADLTTRIATDPSVAAKFANHVVETSHRGDPIAISVVNRAAHHLAELGLDLIGKIDANELYLGGGLLVNEPAFTDLVVSFVKETAPRVITRMTYTPPVAGSLFKGLCHLGLDQALVAARDQVTATLRVRGSECA